MTVTLTTSDGECLEFACAPGQGVPEAAAKRGAVLPSACRSGTCGSCRAIVTDGACDLGTRSIDALPPGERDAGGVLLCRTYPSGPLTADLPYDNSRVLYGGIPVRQGSSSRCRCRGGRSGERIRSPTPEPGKGAWRCSYGCGPAGCSRRICVRRLRSATG